MSFRISSKLASFTRPDEGSSTEARVLRIQSNDTLDVKYGFDRYKEPVDRLGWLMNMHPVSSNLIDFSAGEVFDLNRREKIMLMVFLILFTYLLDSAVLR